MARKPTELTPVFKLLGLDDDRKVPCRCRTCKKVFPNELAFEGHADKCVPPGTTKALGEMSLDELMALYKKSGK